MLAETHRSLSEGRWAALVLLFFAVLSLSSSIHKSGTIDELPHLVFGWEVLSGNVEHASMQKMAATALHAFPLYVLDSFGITLSSRGTLSVARSVSVLFSVLLGVLVFRWSRRLYGPGAGLLSLFLFALEPNILAHSRMATNDMACTLAMFASAMAALSFFKKPTWPRLAGWGVLTGLAQITKHTALLLFPVFFILFVFMRFFLPKERQQDLFSALPARRLMLFGAVFGLLVVGVINGSYGFSKTMEPLGQYIRYVQEISTGRVSDAAGGETWADRVPVPFPRAYVEAFLRGLRYNDVGLGHGPIYLLGRLDPNGFLYYFPVLLLFKVPLGLLLLAGVRLFSLRRSFPEHPADEFLILLSSAVIMVFFTFFCTAQIGIRYLLPIAPFVLVLLGRLWIQGRESRLVRGVVLFCALAAGASSLSFYPHYLSYVTELIPDRKMIYRVLADSNVDWSQNQHYLEAYLQRHPGETIFVNPPGRVAGKVIVNINKLVGVSAPPQQYGWLRENFVPVEHIAYSWLVFQVPKEPGPGASPEMERAKE